ncbi:ABC transporter permease subunit [Parasedimentitalea psychrophila]|uniref:ABC transporter permease subunit n=1 Tax=Parasedimentitalea psychrophila TaxID=2997337 RepID=A0A9Y2P8W7_9RHOB|nr:ABC transporter permease subunit [Parasedimentitalea psychrophila]WIY27345.1 ABC transporter permease subunit [Parasedimentitalea psychrophila]
MKMAANGKRLHPDGEPFNILWEHAVQFGGESFTPLVADYWRAVGVDVTMKEVTSQLSREKAKASTRDINMEWDVPFEPNLISQVEYYIPPYSEGSPLVGQQWGNWGTTNGAAGEEPPAWAARLFELGKTWKTVLPGSDAYIKIGAEMVELRERLGLNRLWSVQYFDWISTIVLHGDFGNSWGWKRPVADVIAERMPFTLMLMYLGQKYFGPSVGGLFSPEFQDVDWNWARAKNLIRHLWVPIIVLGTSGTAYLIRTLRASVLDELNNKMYVIAARAGGLSPTQLLLKYPVRIALNPIVGVVMLNPRISPES